MHFGLGTGKVENRNLSGFHFKTPKICFHFQVSLPHTASITQLMTASHQRVLLGISLEQRSVPEPGSGEKNTPKEVINKGYDTMAWYFSVHSWRRDRREVPCPNQRASWMKCQSFLLDNYVPVNRQNPLVPSETSSISALWVSSSGQPSSTMQNQCLHTLSCLFLSFSKIVPQTRQHSIAQASFHKEPVSSLGTAFVLLPNIQSHLHSGLGLDGQERLQESDSEGTDLAKSDAQVL